MREKWINLHKYKLPRKIRKLIKPMINMLFFIYHENIGFILSFLIDTIQDLTDEKEKIHLRKIEIKYNDYYSSVLNCETNKYELINNRKFKEDESIQL